MSASDAAQGKVIVYPEGVPVSRGELRREEYRALVPERNQARASRKSGLWSLRSESVFPRC
jgi:hypothetical protein